MSLALGDYRTFADGPPHRELAELRQATPVAWQELPGQAGFWAVLRHADVVAVAVRPQLFSANAGGVLVEDLAHDRLKLTRAMLLAMDPPEHTSHRRPLAPLFKARAISTLEAAVRRLCRGIVERIADGEVHDVVAEVATVPTEVIGELVGVPPDERGHVHALAEDIMRGGRRNGQGSDPFQAMAAYAIDFAGRRRREPPGDDITSVVLGADGGGMSDAAFAGFFVQLVTAGNDTTVTFLSNAVMTLLEHPDQLALLRRDPSLAPGAVEEVLRWANPLHYFRRTAMADTTIAGVNIAAGDKVAMYYTAANRDESVFRHPQQFDIRRSPNPHLAFGVGPHHCLGAHLARLEGRVFLEELVTAIADVTLAGPPVRQRSILNNSLLSLPVRLVPAAGRRRQ
jgi:cytochrome P450